MTKRPLANNYSFEIWFCSLGLLQIPPGMGRVFGEPAAQSPEPGAVGELPSPLGVCAGDEWVSGMDGGEGNISKEYSTGKIRAF